MLTTRIVPNLEKGIQVIGFLKDSEIINENLNYDEVIFLLNYNKKEKENYYIHYNSETGLLYGIS